MGNVVSQIMVSCGTLRLIRKKGGVWSAKPLSPPFAQQFSRFTPTN